ncbi:MAG TPA: archease [Methanoregulaceae archaeon]|nr:archease [Methanoregulaceae archaeon]
MSFEELEHTADIKIRVRGATLEELFSEAARALMTIVYKNISQGNIRRHVEVDADDTSSLIREFLSEILFVSEVEDMVITGADIHIAGNHLTADLTGEPFSRMKHCGGREVKGVSYSDLAISQEQDSYILEVIFDV